MSKVDVLAAIAAIESRIASGNVISGVALCRLDQRLYLLRRDLARVGGAA